MGYASFTVPENTESGVLRADGRSCQIAGHVRGGGRVEDVVLSAVSDLWERRGLKAQR
jgi:hypothetical protein